MLSQASRVVRARGAPSSTPRALRRGHGRRAECRCLAQVQPVSAATRAKDLTIQGLCLAPFPLLAAPSQWALAEAPPASDMIAKAAESLDPSAYQPPPANPFATVLFTLCVLALSVVTLGVAYISFLQWQDDTAQKRDASKPLKLETESKPDAGKKRRKIASSKGFGGD